LPGPSYGPFYDFTRSDQALIPLEIQYPLADDLAVYEDQPENTYRLTPCIYYQATYSTAASGFYEISILYYGRHLLGSPYKAGGLLRTRTRPMWNRRSESARLYEHSHPQGESFSDLTSSACS